jgi:hypothetical protein
MAELGEWQRRIEERARAMGFGTARSGGAGGVENVLSPGLSPALGSARSPLASPRGGALAESARRRLAPARAGEVAGEVAPSRSAATQSFALKHNLAEAQRLMDESPRARTRDYSARSSKLALPGARLSARSGVHGANDALESLLGLGGEGKRGDSRAATPREPQPHGLVLQQTPRSAFANLLRSQKVAPPDAVDFGSLSALDALTSPQERQRQIVSSAADSILASPEPAQSSCAAEDAEDREEQSRSARSWSALSRGSSARRLPYQQRDLLPDEVETTYALESYGIDAANPFGSSKHETFETAALTDAASALDGPRACGHEPSLAESEHTLDPDCSDDQGDVDLDAEEAEVVDAAAEGAFNEADEQEEEEVEVVVAEKEVAQDEDNEEEGVYDEKQEQLKWNKEKERHNHEVDRPQSESSVQLGQSARARELDGIAGKGAPRRESKECEASDEGVARTGTITSQTLSGKTVKSFKNMKNVKTKPKTRQTYAEMVFDEAAKREAAKARARDRASEAERVGLDAASKRSREPSHDSRKLHAITDGKSAIARGTEPASTQVVTAQVVTEKPRASARDLDQRTTTVEKVSDRRSSGHGIEPGPQERLTGPPFEGPHPRPSGRSTRQDADREPRTSRQLATSHGEHGLVAEPPYQEHKQQEAMELLHKTEEVSGRQRDSQHARHETELQKAQTERKEQEERGHHHVEHPQCERRQHDHQLDSSSRNDQAQPEHEDGARYSSRRCSPRSSVPGALIVSSSPHESSPVQAGPSRPIPPTSEAHVEAEEGGAAPEQQRRQRRWHKGEHELVREEHEAKYEEQKQQNEYAAPVSARSSHTATLSEVEALSARSGRRRTPRVLEVDNSQPPRSGRGRTPRSLDQGAPANSSSRERTSGRATHREHGEEKRRSPQSETEARSSRGRSPRSPAPPDTWFASPRGRGRSPVEPASPGFAARLPPTSDEHINAYAVYLGMDPERDREWLWLAEECLYAPLPSGWSEARAPNGDTYFWREPNGKAQWEHPLDDFFRQLFRRLRGEARERAARERGVRRQRNARRPRSAAPLGRSREDEVGQQAQRATTPRPSLVRSSSLTLTSLLRSNKVEPAGDGSAKQVPVPDVLDGSRSMPASGRAAEPPHRMKDGRLSEHLGHTGILTVEIPELSNDDGCDSGDSASTGHGRGRKHRKSTREKQQQRQPPSPAASPLSAGGGPVTAPFLLARPFCEWRERPLWWRETGSRHRSSELEVRGRTLAPEHLTALADYFGMELPQDGHLMWIIKLAALCPLPLDWRVCPEEFASDLFFANVRTSATSRHHPMDSFWALLLQGERECPLTAAEQGALAQQAWLRFGDDDGDVFWYDFSRLVSDYDPRGPAASAPLQPPWLVARSCAPGGGGRELGKYHTALWCALAAVHGDAATGRTPIFPLLIGGEAEPFLARHELFKVALLVDWLTEPLGQRVRDARAELEQRRDMVNNLRKTSVHLTKHAAAAKHAMPPPARRTRWPL